MMSNWNKKVTNNQYIYIYNHPNLLKNKNHFLKKKITSKKNEMRTKETLNKGTEAKESKWKINK